MALSIESMVTIWSVATSAAWGLTRRFRGAQIFWLDSHSPLETLALSPAPFFDGNRRSPSDERLQVQDHSTRILISQASETKTVVESCRGFVDGVGYE
jgi:hypothetical protein